METHAPKSIYRPTRFEELIGNRPVKRRLMNSAELDRMPSQVLITGPTGAGKTTTGRIIARRKLCEGARAGAIEACGQCKSCQSDFDGFCSSREFYEEWDANYLDSAHMLDIRHGSIDRHRVYFIDELQDLDVSLMKVLRKVGHAGVATTEKYYINTKPAMRAAAERQVVRSDSPPLPDKKPETTAETKEV